MHFTVSVDGKTHHAVVDGGQVQIDGRVFKVAVGEAVDGEPPEPSGATSTSTPSQAAGVPVEAIMPGKVLRIAAEPGTTVHDGDAVIILEAMKMEIPVPSPTHGEVTQIHVAVGDQVATGALLATVVPG